MSSKETGAQGELIASKFLENKGFLIVARNWKCTIGEIDLVAQKEGVTHIVEVKSGISDVTRGTFAMGSSRPEEMLHERKLRKLENLTRIYLGKKFGKIDCQIDGVGVLMDPVTRKARCTYYPNIIGGF